MTSSKFILALTFLFLLGNSAFSQDEPEAKNLSNGSIKEQFDYIISNSNRYQEYRVVKQAWLDQLKSHTADSLNVVRKELKSKQSLIDDQQAEIDQLKEKLDDSNHSLSAVNNEKDNISFFGIMMKKATYKSIMWAIIAILSALLLIFIMRFASSKSVTAQAKKAHQEVMEEFNNYKNKAMEEEQKLRRKLQDEINKRL
ncbi:MAG: tRNA (guanine-N1)-methyltransferase [Bacteroidetes bacterium]|nr:tRNA (guanine-N1)-methyltransferase [Bacteroidota bacterium]